VGGGGGGGQASKEVRPHVLQQTEQAIAAVKVKTRQERREKGREEYHIITMCGLGIDKNGLRRLTQWTRCTPGHYYEYPLVALTSPAINPAIAMARAPFLTAPPTAISRSLNTRSLIFHVPCSITHLSPFLRIFVQFLFSSLCATVCMLLNNALLVSSLCFVERLPPP
jgi:hypothetical protein